MKGIFNIGNNNTVKLMDFISEIENNLGVVAEKEMYPMQQGDVKMTWANVSGLVKDYNYKPDVKIKKGVESFINWYIEFYIKKGS